MEINEMLTLSDINLLTDSHDGDIYSDLYKDVYGCRPRYAQFVSVEEFDQDYEFLCKKLSYLLLLSMLVSNYDLLLKLQVN